MGRVDMQQTALAEKIVPDLATGHTLVLAATPDAAVVVPGGDWLLKADFQPQGPDLLLTGADGEQILIRDFFNLEAPPDLMTEGGAVITAELAVRLAGPEAPGQFALLQNGPFQLAQAAAEKIGQVEATDGLVEVIHADGSRVTLAKGDAIFQGDTIETGGGAAIGITFVDDTTFSLGADGRMVIDEMVYDPATQEGVFSADLVQGVFSFVSGQVAKSNPDGMIVSTPVATLGIRGTKVAGRAAQEGEQNTISLLPETDAQGNTFVGQLSVTNQGGTVTLNQVGATVQMSSAFTPPPPPVVFTPQQIQQNFGAALTTLSTTVAVKATNKAAKNAEEAGQAQAEADQAMADAEAAAEEAEAKAAEAEAAAEEAEASGDPEAIAAAEAAQAEAEAKAAEAEAKAAEAEAKTAEAEAKTAEAAVAQAEAEHAGFEMQTQSQAFATFGQGPGGPDGGPDQVEAAAERAAKAAIEAGASPEDVFAAAAEAAAAQLAAEGDNPEDIAAETAAAEEAFKAAMAAGATPEEAMALAMQAANDFFGPDNGNFGPGGPDGPGDFGGDFGGNFGGFGGDPFFGGGDPFFGGGDPFGGNDFFAGNDFFGDPLSGDGGSDFFGDLGSYGDVYDPYIGEYFDLNSILGNGTNDDGTDYVPQQVVSQTTFSEIFKGTTGADTLSGTTGNTNFYFAYNAIGGIDSITDAGGTNQMAFDNLNDTVLKFTISGSSATTGNVKIWGGNSVAGYTSISGSNATYTLTGTPYSGTADSTIAFTGVGQYLFADSAVATLSGNYSSQSSANLTTTPTDADSGDVIVMPSLEINDVGFVIAAGDGADILNIDDSGMDGIIAFGKGGGDTFNISVAMDALLIGGITNTDNKDTDSDGIPDQYVNTFSYSALNLTGTTGLNGTIIGFYDSYSSSYETSAVMNNSAAFLNNMLWDVGAFVGSADNDTISISGYAALNSFSGGGGDDTITIGNSVRALSIDGGDGNDTITGGTAADIILGGAGNDTLVGGGGSDTVSYQNAASAVTVTVNGASQVTGGDGTDSLSGFENLTGSAYNDSLTGDGNNNIIAGGAGNDTLIGGGGTDTASYIHAASAVTVTVNGASQVTGGDGTDSLSGFTNLIGSDYNDSLTGDTGANTLTGGDGSDTLTGSSGADIFAYTTTRDGGTTVAAADTIMDFTGGTDKVQLLSSGFGSLASLTANTTYFEISWAGGDAAALNTALGNGTIEALMTVTDATDYMAYLSFSDNAGNEDSGYFLLYDDDDATNGMTVLADMNNTAPTSFDEADISFA